MTERQVFAPDALAGQVAVVTGGGTGIGYGISRALLRHGATVAIASRNAERLAAAAETLKVDTGGTCVAVPCDVREEGAVRALARSVREQLGPVSLVVNNAAGNFRMAAEKVSARGFRTVVDIDLFGTFHVSQAFVRDMITAGGGSIISILMPDPERGFPLYSPAGAAKSAILSLTRSWAREWGPHGIRVNAIGPGPIPTEGVAVNMMGMSSQESSDVFGNMRDTLPLRRLGTADDVAAAVLFLASPAGSWITGNLLNVDGGVSLP